MIKIIATSDLHGELPEIPECDLWIIAGDVCPVRMSHDPHVQTNWLMDVWQPYIEEQPVGEILWIAGNHDFGLQALPGKETARKIGGYLEDNAARVGGTDFYGTPWVPNLRHWAFFDGGDERAKIKFSNIPDKCDVLITHGPPQGYSDFVSAAGHIGSLPLLDRINEVKPKIVICGHIHEGFGTYKMSDDTTLYNVAYVDEFYEPTHSLVEINLNL